MIEMRHKVIFRRILIISILLLLSLTIITETLVCVVPRVHVTKELTIIFTLITDNIYLVLSLIIATTFVYLACTLEAFVKEYLSYDAVKEDIIIKMKRIYIIVGCSTIIRAILI